MDTSPSQWVKNTSLQPMPLNASFTAAVGMAELL